MGTVKINITKSDVGMKIIYLILLLMFVSCRQTAASGFDEKLTCKKVNFSKPCWLKASNKDCYIWNEAPEQGESLSILSGDCKNRLATSFVKLQWNNGDKETAEYRKGRIFGKQEIISEKGTKLIVYRDEKAADKACVLSSSSQKNIPIYMGLFSGQTFSGLRNTVIFPKLFSLCYGHFQEMYALKKGHCLLTNGARIEGQFHGVLKPVGTCTYTTPTGATITANFDEKISFSGKDVVIRFKDTQYVGHFSKNNYLDGSGTFTVKQKTGDVVYSMQLQQGAIHGKVVAAVPGGRHVSLLWNHGLPVKPKTGNNSLEITQLNLLLMDRMDVLIKAIVSKGKVLTPISFVVKTFSTGTYYGELKNGKREGRGVFVSDDGKLYYGHWKNDKRDGKGFMQTMPDCEMKEGVWKDGVFQD